VVGNNDQNDLPYQYQYQNPNPNLNTPRPSQANNFYFQNERKPQQKQQPATQHQHNYQISNQQIHQQQHATSAGYLRFPSSPKIKRPIVIATTTEMPYIIHPTENSYNYYYDYSQTSPKPIVRPSPIFNKHGDHAVFLPTIPPSPNSFPEQQEQLQFTTKTKKQRRPKPKRPTTPVTTTTTTDKYGALNELLDGYDLGNRLSNKITADNIGSSIQTLSAVLQLLQNEADEPQARPLRPKKPKPEYRPDPIDEYDDTGDVGNPGRPGVDYPTLSVIPKTSFDCKTQRYKGFFGDPETLCQVFNVILYRTFFSACYTYRLLQTFTDRIDKLLCIIIIIYNTVYFEHLELFSNNYQLTINLTFKNSCPVVPRIFEKDTGRWADVCCEVR